MKTEEEEKEKTKIRHFVIDAIASGIPEMLSLWKEDKKRDFDRRKGAIHLLATWAHLQRFPSKALPPCAATLADLIEHEGREMAETTVDTLKNGTGYWLRQAKEFVQVYEALFPDSPDEKEMRSFQKDLCKQRSLTLFTTLDLFDLAAWATSDIGYFPDPKDVRLAKSIKMLCACSWWLKANITAFRETACYAKNMLAGYDLARLENKDDPSGAFAALAATSDKYKWLGALCE